MKILSIVLVALSLTAYAEEKTHSSAKAFCESKGQRLPTAREIAELATAKNAQGILELSQAGTQVPAGYYSVTAQESNGSIDKFYYSHLNYKKEGDATGCIWASSVNPEYPLAYGHYEIKFDLKSGRIDDHVMTGRNTINKCDVFCTDI